MKKKVYAAWFPKKETEATFFNDWESCQSHIAGISGIRYRGFPDLKHAEEFLGIIPPQHDLGDKGLFTDKKTHTQLLIYVDGSYFEGCPYAGWAWVALSVDQSKQKKQIYETKVGEGRGTTPQPAMSRNIDGEVTAVLQAVKWVEGYLHQIKSGWQKIQVTIFYDYQGIEFWARGIWKAKSSIGQHYQKAIIPYRHHLRFHKVSAHSGKKWNEYVDRLAKEAIREITLNDQ